ncbi:hypothetical protein GM661_14460 [Iocasia frigidifontis]|uniref:Maltose/galactoside acetyltransferase domain-containing protein n=1 Tax=Iocasia fonsfrigidae TaxID=2682810 RepID=A0A8A7KLW6_9FIRM|nr:hypothetical protein GM661_14460 [Iocasia fonsfrigidae]
MGSEKHDRKGKNVSRRTFYNTSDEQLVKERSYARKMTKRFNQSEGEIKLKY